MTEPDTEVDLFGSPVDAPQQHARTRPPINDMALIEDVLAAAISPGYALVGSPGEVFRDGPDHEVSPVPRYEADAVCQLIDTKFLTVGGSHTYTCRGRSGPGRSVLVPRTTQQQVERWKNLARLPGRGPNRKVS
jgi:hypothetical protein